MTLQASPPNEVEVDVALAQLRAPFASDAEYAQRLDRAGFVDQSYAEYVQRLLSIRSLVEREVAPRLAVSDEEVHAYYEAERARFTRPKRRRAWRSAKSSSRRR